VRVIIELIRQFYGDLESKLEFKLFKKNLWNEETTYNIDVEVVRWLSESIDRPLKRF
jgi:hypothetical protein